MEVLLVDQFYQKQASSKSVLQQKNDLTFLATKYSNKSMSHDGFHHKLEMAKKKCQLRSNIRHLSLHLSLILAELFIGKYLPGITASKQSLRGVPSFSSGSKAH